jgi:hypothetical protein
MNKFIRLNIILFIFSGLLVTSCDHETDTFDGPSLVDRFGPFNVTTDLEASRSTVDFANGEEVVFTAQFNKNVNWVLEITGMESGSVKRIEGFSRTIDASNATWDGGTTVLPLFGAEVCTAVLTVPEEPSYTGTATVETVSRKSYADAGVLFTDFETALGPDAFIGNFEFEFTAQTGRQTDNPAEGDTYFLLEGTDNVVPNFFVGLVDISATVTGETYVQVPTTVPEDLYFNCFLYSDAGPHGLAIIDFIIDSNDSGEFEDGQDAAVRVSTDYNLATWEGWRKISHPMSETGVTQAQLEKLVAIRLLLISDLNAQPDPPLQVDYGIDFMIFTSGGPLVL